MFEIIAGVVLLMAGLGLFASEHHEVGLILAPTGGLLLFRGVRRARRSASVSRDLSGLANLTGEINRRLSLGETPDQIAAAFDSSHRIAPVLTLRIIAADRLALIGRLDQEIDMISVIAWASSGRPAEPLTPREAIASLNRRTTLFGAAPEVRLDGDSATPVRGTLIAARSHLLFLVDPHYQSQLSAFIQGAIPLPIPKLLEIVKMGGEISEAIETETREDITPEAIADLEHRLGLPGSFAIPWRQMQDVYKEGVEGRGPPRVELVVNHGAETGESETVRLMAGNGLNEVWVDDWVELIKVVGLLDGALLLTNN